MNTTERTSLEWLKQKGYSGIIFRSRKSPDFITEQGISFEVKKSRNNTIYFGNTQIIQLNELPETVILIFDDGSEPLAQFQFSEIRGGKKVWKNFHITYEGPRNKIISISFDESELAQIKKMASQLHLGLSSTLRMLAMKNLNK